ncbi:MAG: CRP-like cAMP-binding protein [Lysobacterales bacterium]|jgi:CRP-like cAMP-binding protein
MQKEEIGFLELLDNQDQFFSIDAGSVLFHEGETGGTMFVILKGEVSLTISGQELGTEMEGGIVGEMSLIDETDRSATATASSDCLLAPLDREAFLVLVRKKPEFAIHVMQVLSQRLRLANDILTRF